MFDKILIANRGEIAVRVIRTAREMGIRTVAVYSEPDRGALHVTMADEAFFIGPAAASQSYLDGQKIVEVALRARANAIHPGYGFLAENAAFARLVVAHGLVWIGPHADAIDAMGDKLQARLAMQRAGVPIVPGETTPLRDAAAAREAATAIGLPLALKASAGGGGKGLKIARTSDDIESAFANARREAETYFGNGTIYAERYLENPKHIELQILADKLGNVIHAGERDCSLQRRHQKLWEEAPATIPDSVRNAMRAAGVRAAAAIGYDSVGTIECLVAGDEFFFLEMNTRIQVEHTVTEMVSGLDLVREQIAVAAGEPLSCTQNDIRLLGWAIEGRVNAEDPARAFRPAPGTISHYREPGGPGVRVDSAAYCGWTISADYDSMIAKLIVWAPTRPQAIARMRRALDEYQIGGVTTTVPLLRMLCDEPAVARGDYTTSTLETVAAGLSPDPEVAAPPPAGGHGQRSASDSIRVEVNDRLYRVRLFDLSAATGAPAAQPSAPRRRNSAAAAAHASGDDIVSPMHGVIVEVKTVQGAQVAQGDVVAVVEAMKMMNELRSHRDGTVAQVHGLPGDAIESGAAVVTLA